LKQILKSKTTNKKSLEDLIEEFIALQSSTTKTYLETFLSDLLIYINQNFDAKDKDTLLAIVESKLSEFKIPFETKEIESVYEKIAVATSVGATTVTFNKTDIATMNMIRKSLLWAGDDYSISTQNKIKDIIGSAYEGEITRAEITAKIKEKFEEIIDKDDNYFKLVSDNAISQGQNISRVNQALKYDVKAFKVRVILDNSTSDICISMKGKIIPAEHLQKQMDNILNAKDIEDKKGAAIWSSKPIYGKMPSNFGIPPYHGFCRSSLDPVWITETSKIDPKTKKPYKVINTGEDKAYKLKHIDKTGIEVKISEKVYNKAGKNKHKLTEKQLIGALNDIKYKAPHGKIAGRSVALTNAGYTLVYEADKLITCFPPERRASSYFNDNAVLNKVTNVDTGEITERVKKWYEIF